MSCTVDASLAAAFLPCPIQFSPLIPPCSIFHVPFTVSQELWGPWFVVWCSCVRFAMGDRGEIGNSASDVHGDGARRCSGNLSLLARLALALWPVTSVRFPASERATRAVRSTVLASAFTSCNVHGTALYNTLARPFRSCLSRLACMRVGPSSPSTHLPSSALGPIVSPKRKSAWCACLEISDPCDPSDPGLRQHAQP